MGNEGRNGREYYTPRQLIRAIVKVIDPKVGEKVLDPAVGSAGILREAFDHTKPAQNFSTEQQKQQQTSTYYGREVKSLAPCFRSGPGALQKLCAHRDLGFSLGCPIC
jgi:type I restriction enzyme M protein